MLVLLVHETRRGLSTREVGSWDTSSAWELIMASRPRASAYEYTIRYWRKQEPGLQNVLDHPARMVGGDRSIDLAELSDLSERRDAGLRPTTAITAAEVCPCPAGLNKSFYFIFAFTYTTVMVWATRKRSVHVRPWMSAVCLRAQGSSQSWCTGGLS